MRELHTSHEPTLGSGFGFGLVLAIVLGFVRLELHCVSRRNRGPLRSSLCAGRALLEDGCSMTRPASTQIKKL